MLRRAGRDRIWKAGFTMVRRTSAAVGFMLVLALSSTAGAQTPAALPDWGGVWQMMGNTVFDRATVQPQNGRAGDAGVREAPPYNDEWEAIYRKNIELIKQGSFLTR